MKTTLECCSDSVRCPAVINGPVYQVFMFIYVLFIIVYLYILPQNDKQIRTSASLPDSVSHLRRVPPVMYDVCPECLPAWRSLPETSSAVLVIQRFLAER